MLWVATPRLAVVKVAWPLLSVPVPKVVAPSLKVTVPEGVPAPGALAVTVAVNVTDWPDTAGFVADDSAVVVATTVGGAAFTVWLSAAEVLPVKLASPPYTAVIEWLPTVKLEVVKVAWPALRVAVPRVVAPS